MLFFRYIESPTHIYRVNLELVHKIVSGENSDGSFEIVFFFSADDFVKCNFASFDEAFSQTSLQLGDDNFLDLHKRI